MAKPYDHTMWKDATQTGILLGGIGIDYSIKKHRDNYNGYVWFKKRLTLEGGYFGILTYVPVHGGITYADPYNGGMVYGFDTMHYDSSGYPINDLGWLRRQCEIMASGIKQAAKVEEKYLRETDQNKKADLAQTVIDVCSDEEFSGHSIGVMMNLMTGEI